MRRKNKRADCAAWQAGVRFTETQFWLKKETSSRNAQSAPDIGIRYNCSSLLDSERLRLLTAPSKARTFKQFSAESAQMRSLVQRRRAFHKHFQLNAPKIRENSRLALAEVRRCSTKGMETLLLFIYKIAVLSILKESKAIFSRNARVVYIRLKIDRKRGTF